MYISILQCQLLNKWYDNRIVLSGIYDFITCMMLVRACEITQEFEYSSLLKYVGKWWEYLGACIVIYVCFSTCLGYSIIVGDFLSDALIDFGVTIDYIREICIVGSTLFVFLPLTLLKNIESLKYSSIFGVIAIFYCLFLLIVLAVTSALFDDTFTPGQYISDPTSEYVLWDINIGLLIVSNVCSKAFVAHYTIPNIYEALYPRTIPRMLIVSVVSYIICGIVYIAFGFCGYYLFGSNAESDILSSFGTTDTMISVTIARIAMTISIFGCYPLVFKAMITTIENKFFNSDTNKKYNFIKYPSLRVFIIISLVFFASILSLFLEDVGPVSSIEGAVTVIGIISLFPVLMTWKLKGKTKLTLDQHKLLIEPEPEIPDNNHRFTTNSSSEKISRQPGNISKIYRIYLLSMLFIGVSLGIFGMYAQIVSS